MARCPSEAWDSYIRDQEKADHSDWTGSRLTDISKEWGIEGPADCLRAIDKYGSATVSIRLPNGECFCVPDDLEKIRKLPADEPVEAWIIHGIAWDGSDWEYSEDVSSVDQVRAAINRFKDALAEHSSCPSCGSPDCLAPDGMCKEWGISGLT